MGLAREPLQIEKNYAIAGAENVESFNGADYGTSTVSSPALVKVITPPHMHMS